MMNSTVLEFLISIIRYIRTILLFNHHSQRVSNCSVLCLSAKLSWNKTDRSKIQSSSDRGMF